MVTLSLQHAQNSMMNVKNLDKITTVTLLKGEHYLF